MTVAGLNAVSALAAFVAANFWLASALVTTPNEINVGFGGVGGSAQDLGNAISAAEPSAQKAPSQRIGTRPARRCLVARHLTATRA